MKALLGFFLAVLPLTTFAQGWTKQYTTAAGVSLQVGDSILLLPGKALTFVYPRSARDAPQTGVYRRYLGVGMPGRSYAISRFSRLPAGPGAYKALAVLEVWDRAADRWNKVEYLVQIEDALQAGQIELRPLQR